ncbi:MAG: GlsB/YeaQ/YmgE family stress response membrane protein [Opitutaceae bacterium]
MDINEIVGFLLIGGVAGWLAGLILKGRGRGIIGNIIVGIIGAFLGGSIFRALDISLGNDLLGVLATATVGSIVLLFLLSLIRKK